MSEGYDALRHGAAWIDLTARGRILVRGRDRARLLHNVSTNDIKNLKPRQGCYAFLLTPQGRILADLHLFCFSDHFLIDTSPELRAKVAHSILKYKVADQVELEDVTETSSAIGLEGPAAAAILSALNGPVPGEAYSHLPWGEATIANISVTGQPGFRIFGPRAAMPDFAAAGAKQASEEDVQIVRIENGRPRYGEDIRETSLPQETQQMQAVSFTKGCYIGQEIVERIRAQGHVNKKLVRLAIDSSMPPSPGTKVSVDGTEAGEITSAVFSPERGAVSALAYVRVAYAEPATLLKAGEHNARVVA